MVTIDALIQETPSIVGSFSAPSRGLASEAMAEYAIVRYNEDDRENQVFFVYFIRDANVAWRIESM